MQATGRDRGGIPGLPRDVDAMLAFPRQHPLAVRWMDRPFDELVARHIADPGARRVLGALTGYISDGREKLTCAQMVPIFGYYFHGGYYPVGGSGRLAEALVEAIEARGGEVRLKTRVARILVEEGRAAGVELADGTRVDGARGRRPTPTSSAPSSSSSIPRPLPAGFPRPHRRGGTRALGVHGASRRRLCPGLPPGDPCHGERRRRRGPLSGSIPRAAPDGHSTVALIKLAHLRGGARMVPRRGRRGLEGLALRRNTNSASARWATR